MKTFGKTSDIETGQENVPYEFMQANPGVVEDLFSEGFWDWLGQRRENDSPAWLSEMDSLPPKVRERMQSYLDWKKENPTGAWGDLSWYKNPEQMLQKIARTSSGEWFHDKVTEDPRFLAWALGEGGSAMQYASSGFAPDLIHRMFYSDGADYGKWAAANGYGEELAKWMMEQGPATKDTASRTAFPEFWANAPGYADWQKASSTDPSWLYDTTSPGALAERRKAMGRQEPGDIGAPAYICGTCGVKFALQEALMQHQAITGHAGVTQDTFTGPGEVAGEQPGAPGAPDKEAETNSVSPTSPGAAPTASSLAGGTGMRATNEPIFPWEPPKNPIGPIIPPDWSPNKPPPGGGGGGGGGGGFTPPPWYNPGAPDKGWGARTPGTWPPVDPDTGYSPFPDLTATLPPEPGWYPNYVSPPSYLPNYLGGPQGATAQTASNTGMRPPRAQVATGIKPAGSGMLPGTYSTGGTSRQAPATNFAQALAGARMGQPGRPPVPQNSRARRPRRV